MSLQVTRLVDNAILPTRGSPGAAGLDLYSADGYVVMPGHRVVVSTGISVKLPVGTYGRVAPRSGLAVKHGLDTLAGVVDPDYTGEVKVVLQTTAGRPAPIEPLFTGEEIWCQLFSEPGSGSDFAGLSGKAVKDGDEWLVNAQKVWTTLAHVSTFKTKNGLNATHGFSVRGFMPKLGGHIDNGRV